MYLNKATIIGNLTRDPEKKALPNGNTVTNFSLATNRYWKDQDGNQKEATEYHNIVVFGRAGENAAQYLVKGQSALVEGRMQTRSWEDQDGNKKYRTEVIADIVQFGSKNSSGGSGSQNNSNKNDSESNNQNSGNDSNSSENNIEYPEEEINPEDIPF